MLIGTKTYLVATVVPIRIDSIGVKSNNSLRGIAFPECSSRICRMPSAGASSYSEGLTERSLKTTSLVPGSCPGSLAQLRSDDLALDQGPIFANLQVTKCATTVNSNTYTCLLDGVRHCGRKEESLSSNLPWYPIRIVLDFWFCRIASQEGFICT